jgi:hypothetical protein
VNSWEKCPDHRLRGRGFSGFHVNFKESGGLEPPQKLPSKSDVETGKMGTSLGLGASGAPMFFNS